MTDRLKDKQRITLGQLTLDLQRLAADQAEQRENKPLAQSSGRLENAIASHIALGMAKQRSGNN